MSVLGEPGDVLIDRWLPIACILAKDGCPNPATAYVAVGDRRRYLCAEHLAEAEPIGAFEVCAL